MDKGTKGIMAMEQWDQEEEDQEEKSTLSQSKYTEEEPESRPQEIKLIMMLRKRYVDTFNVRRGSDRPDQCTRLHKCSAKNGGAKHACRIILFTYIRHLNHLGQGI